MIRKLSTFAAAALVAVALAGCATNEQTGALGGAAAGALIGNSVGGGSGRAAATAIGAGVGALGGAAVGRSVDERNRQQYYQPAPPRCGIDRFGGQYCR